MARTTPREQRDHVDAFLETIADELPGLDLEVEAIVDRILGLSRRLKRTMEETLHEFGLSYGEWQLLGSLRRRPRSPGWLADHHDLSSGAMTNRLDRLETAGLVRRERDPNDRRALIVEITDEGRAVWESAVGTQAVKEQLVTSALSEAEKKRLNALLRRLMLEFERREGFDASCET